VNVLESTAILTFYANQKLMDSLFLALCIWCLKKLIILWRRAWISFVQVDGGLDFRGLDRVLWGSVVMCSTKACNLLEYGPYFLSYFNIPCYTVIYLIGTSIFLSYNTIL
jgi:hypothetical protein